MPVNSNGSSARGIVNATEFEAEPGCVATGPILPQLSVSGTSRGHEKKDSYGSSAAIFGSVSWTACEIYN
jgi:hypothetical protein